MPSRQKRVLREVKVSGPDGVIRKGELIQYEHWIPSDQHGNPERWVESDCLRLRLRGCQEGKQCPHYPDDFFIDGVGTFKLVEDE